MEAVQTATDGEPTGDFLADTAATPHPVVDGRSTLELSPAWNVFYVFGGITMACALRAAVEAVDRPELDVLTATAVYSAPVPHGPLVLDTRVLRSSKAAAQCTTELSVGTDEQVSVNPAEREPALHLTTVLGKRHDTHIEFTDSAYPLDVPDPDDCDELGSWRDNRSGTPDDGDGSSPAFFPRINFHDQLHWRSAIGHAPTDTDWEPGPARYAAWMRFRRDPRLADGTLDPVALCVPGDSVGPSIWQRLGPFGPERPPFVFLSLEITLHVLAPTTSSWLLQDVRCHWAGSGYGVGTTHLWDDQRRLVALAVQRARLRPFDPGQLPSTR